MRRGALAIAALALALAGCGGSNGRSADERANSQLCHQVNKDHPNFNINCR